MGKLAKAVAHVPRKIVYAEMAGDSVMVNEQVAVDQVCLGMREEILPVSLCQKKTLCKVANTLLTAGATDLGTPDAVVMAPDVKHTNPELGRGVMRVAVESRLPKGERTSTVEVAHHITDDTGDATTGDHHVVHTVVVPIPSKMDMVMNCRMLGWSRTSCDHSVVAPIDITVGSTDQGPLTSYPRENKVVTMMGKPSNRAIVNDVRIDVLANPVKRVAIVAGRVTSKKRVLAQLSEIPPGG